ncbi:NAD-dependent succinate-semialdehyde dehydrogenase [Flexivirga oryzae]|uniref:Succinate-semialdehyde dehydrogenase/glutarate-semialdehyde dehydrogenase n=1 Tax=Flexivirga oryzae TaxID=1794944 RepID=A0A839N9D7_9MICO|nr:NAD-dependent succinate-semialdehyde dehydrogenase [Flexivirga oryzae]MBB2893837.1 succinate-semialdehyde dehydrogenase/glutarate-semialdehyde dehydrogenase [Flexivirga oryzae]
MSVTEAALIEGKAFIGGAWRDADSGARIDVTDPATGELVGTVPDMGRDECRAAIRAAADALPAWSALTAKERATFLMRMYDAMTARADELAELLTREQGKPLAEARAEVISGATFLEYYAEEARRVNGEILAPDAHGRRLMVLRQPIGVVAAITPWNFPSSMIMRKIAPALAAGCTVVVKPAELTPFSALAFGSIAEQAGLPAGVLNIVTGQPAPIGEEITSNPTVRKLSFTGSTAVGKLLSRQSADTVKRVTMELGGNAPFIVFADADLDLAVKAAVGAKFRNAGQTCISANRIYVEATVHDEFVRRLKQAAEQLVVGNGLEPGTDVGPLIDDRAVAKVETLLRDAAANGATIETGGTRAAAGGRFFSPTIVTNAPATADIACTEIFGPVASIYPFTTEDEVVANANATPYGLSAYVFTEDYRRGWRVGEALEFGMIGVNDVAIATPVAPFGGVKESGSGREGSAHGIDDYTELKLLVIGGLR